MFWNCKGNRMVIHDPQGDERNWAVGCIFNEVTNVGDMTTEPLGFVESSRTRIAAIPSLFKMQLLERLDINRQNQIINFPSISQKTTLSPDFYAGASASSRLPILYTSSNPSVATIVNGKIRIVGIGSSIITAYQNGNEYFKPGQPITQSLQVNFADPSSIIISPNPNKGLLDISFNLSVFSLVKIDLYNAAGMLMQSLLNEDIKSVGLQKRNFILKDVASGSYFIKLFINNESYAYKIVIDR
jgi:hypothetical protein